MENISQYLLSIVAASIICAIAVNLGSKDSACQSIIKLLAGIFLAVTVISPWSTFRFNEILSYIDSINTDAATLTTQSNEQINIETSSIISEHIKTYIKNKADALGATLEVEVFTSIEPPYAPYEVSLRGDISPYAKNALQQTIQNDLGIPKEQQIWN